ncbi:SRPBCC domain-containing protein [Paenibacillus sp. 1011MAR3C5]|uniref:SRPBCC family protein n=1 Tax=Paenibacillus sp. 1011MAR3C5 TaxID=1675787 RepID=UPI000E6BA7E3|nr:SRPBCC domain-containing protein [Paenibacillus sp. 1011MAR3C5]RJE86069.1 SRPBCC domain-containing protein [Paenibacillus sp. 1011MAR3C5]
MSNEQQGVLADVVKEVTIKAPIAKVWEAVATAEGIAAWFMPNNFEPILGHEFQLNAGPFGHSPCKVLELDPPNRLVFSWDKDWTVTFELEEVDEGTQFTLIHGGWNTDTVTAFGEKHAVVRERMAGGWTGIVQKLVRTVEG